MRTLSAGPLISKLRKSELARNKSSDSVMMSSRSTSAVTVQRVSYRSAESRSSAVKLQTWRRSRTANLGGEGEEGHVADEAVVLLVVVARVVGLKGYRSALMAL